YVGHQSDDFFPTLFVQPILQSERGRVTGCAVMSEDISHPFMRGGVDRQGRDILSTCQLAAEILRFLQDKIFALNRAIQAELAAASLEADRLCPNPVVSIFHRGEIIVSLFVGEYACSNRMPLLSS